MSQCTVDSNLKGPKQVSQIYIKKFRRGHVWLEPVQCRPMLVNGDMEGNETAEPDGNTLVQDMSNPSIYNSIPPWQPGRRSACIACIGYECGGGREGNDDECPSCPSVVSPCRRPAVRIQDP